MTDHDVTDYDPGVQEILDRQVPLRLDAQSDWAGALGKAEGSGRDHWRGHMGEWVAARMRSPRLLAPGLVIAVLVIAGAAAGSRLWRGPSPAEIDTSHATSLVEYTLTTDINDWKAGDRIALWRLPQPDGSTCVMPALASPNPTTSDHLGGGSCGMSNQVPPRKPIWITWQMGWPDGPGGSWLLHGNVSSGSDIARMEIRSDARTIPLAYSHYWFLGELPPSSHEASLPKRGQYTLVGYDGQGQLIVRRDLRETCCPVPHPSSAP